MDELITTLAFQNVSKFFGETRALNQFSLTLHQGELVTLLGPSGCGKTTALRIAAGFEKPNTGTVSLDQQNITTTAPHHRNMGMVFQNYSLFPHLTVSQNIAFGLRVRKIERSELNYIVEQTIDRVRLHGLGDRYPHQLSGGQQQRVALARALAISPKVLLLDEPLSALDAKVRAELRDEIRRIQSESGVATLFVTHDQDEALSISDRICVMKDGDIQQVGTPSDIYLHPVNDFVARFVGSTNQIIGQVCGLNLVNLVGINVQIPVKAAVGTDVIVLLRPDAVTITERFTSDSIPATVVGHHFSGATTVIRLRLDDPILKETTVSSLCWSRKVDVKVGDGVGVRFDFSNALTEMLVS